MIGPTNSAHGRVQRNRWISPRQVQLLHALWSARLRRANRRVRPERSRQERLRHFAEIVGHEVTTSRELSWREANRILHRLLEEVRAHGSPPARAAAGTPKAVLESQANGGPRHHDSAKSRSESPAIAPLETIARPEAAKPKRTRSTPRAAGL
ncbi:MAG: hypothetical protein ACRD88_18150 [Terriglobia bacterium]